jgi:hypothetical protein
MPEQLKKAYSQERLGYRVKPFENVTLAIHVAPFDM